MSEPLTLDDVRQLRASTPWSLPQGIAERLLDAAETVALLRLAMEEAARSEVPTVEAWSDRWAHEDAEEYHAKWRHEDGAARGSGPTLLDALRAAHGGDDDE